MTTNPDSWLQYDGRSRAANRISFLLLALLFAFGSTATFGAVTWTGSAGDKLWSSIGNWDSGFVPGITNDVLFGANDTTGTSGPTGSSNNVVDVNTTIQSLTYSNLDNLFHTTYIPLNTTLTIAPSNVVGGNVILVGSGTANASDAPQIYATINGPGTLLVSNVNANINVRQGNTANNGCLATLDLSGLNSFNAIVGKILLGGDGNNTVPLNRTHGVMVLAQTNSIKLTATPGMILGFDSAGANNDSGDLQLGQTNAIFCDSGLSLGLAKGSGSIEFKTGLINPSVTFRNAAGTGRQANWILGDAASASSASTACNGIVDFSLGTVDALIDTILMGRGQVGSSATGNGNASLTFLAGQIDVNTVICGTANSGGNRSGGNGTITVGGTGQMTVNGDLQLGLWQGSSSTVAASGQPFGIVNINGATAAVWVKGDIRDGKSPRNLTAINVTGGSLKVGGQIGTKVAANTGPLENFTLDAAILTLTVSATINATNPVASVTNLTINNSLTLNVQGGGFGLGQYPLIKYYSGSIGGSGFPAITLNSLPARTFGYLSNNTVDSSIDLVVTNISFIKWNGNVAGGDWNINSSANWKDTVSGLPATYTENTVPGDTTLFDDSASGTTTVNLTTNLSPTSVTVSNITKLYAFKGPGGIGSSAGIFIKNGSGSLVITNSGTNTFSGGLTINGGTVQLGLSANRLPPSGNVTLANAAGVTLDLGGFDQTVGSLSGGGASGGNVNLGAGNLTTSSAGNFAGVISGSGHYTKFGGAAQGLSGANLYGGGTTVSGGSLNLDNATGNGTGTGSVEIGVGAVLNIGIGGTGGSVSTSALLTNNGTINLNRTVDFTLPNTITGSGNINQNNTNTVTMTGNNSYSGQLTSLFGPVRVTSASALGSGSVYVQNSGIIQTPASCLQIQGGLNITNAIFIDQKNAAFGPIPAVESVSGSNVLSGPMTWFIGGSYWRFQVDAGSKLYISSPINNTTAGTRIVEVIGDGDGEFASGIPIGAGAGDTRLSVNSGGTWVLSGTNTYNGTTTVNGGRLVVNGEVQSLSTLEVVSNATLNGTGDIMSPVQIDGGGTLGVGGNNIGTLFIINNLSLAPDSTNVFKVSHSAHTNDVIAGLASVTYDGTLKIQSVGGALVAGDSFVLFPSTAYNGVYANIDPPTPGPGLAWDTSNLGINGTLAVVGNGAPHLDAITKRIDKNYQLVISGNIGTNYTILASTNVALPVASWTVLSSGTIGSSPFTYDDLTATNFQRRFYIMSAP